MRHVDADSLISLVQDATILSDGFKQGFVAIVNGEPTIEPERKKGKWIDDVIGGTLPVIVCNKCNTFYPLQFGDSHNFCPNCGVDMRGEQE